MAATDGSVREPQAATDDDPYEPPSMSAGVIFARPGAMGPDEPDPCHPCRLHQNCGDTEWKGIPEVRGSAAGSLRILGEPSYMRAELGAIHLAISMTPPTEALTILTDSLSAIHLLCRWRRKRLRTPYVRRAKCRHIVRRILDLLMERTRLGTPTTFVKVRAHSSDELNVTADRLADMGHATRVFRGPLRLTGPDKGDQVGRDAEQGN